MFKIVLEPLWNLKNNGYRTYKGVNAEPHT